jgi:hypothetical protein
MAPATIISWFIDDDDVAATRGLTPTTQAPQTARA